MVRIKTLPSVSMCYWLCDVSITVFISWVTFALIFYCPF